MPSPSRPWCQAGLGSPAGRCPTAFHWKPGSAGADCSGPPHLLQEVLRKADPWHPPSPVAPAVPPVSEAQTSVHLRARTEPQVLLLAGAQWTLELGSLRPAPGAAPSAETLLGGSGPGEWHCLLWTQGGCWPLGALPVGLAAAGESGPGPLVERCSGPGSPGQGAGWGAGPRKARGAAQRGGAGPPSPAGRAATSAVGSWCLLSLSSACSLHWSPGSCLTSAGRGPSPDVPRGSGVAGPAGRLGPGSPQPASPLPCLFQNGTQKSWDFMKTHDSVTLLLFNSSRRSLVLVRQFRPAVYAGEVERHFPGSLAAVGREGPRELQPALPGVAGVTVELCAGLVDQPGLSLEEVACKEAWEECGYRLAPSSLRRVATYRSGVGLTGSCQTMFYAEVTDAQRSGPGGGLADEGELIEVVHLPLEGAQAFVDDPDIPKTLGVIFGISWFLGHVAPTWVSSEAHCPTPQPQ